MAARKISKSAIDWAKFSQLVPKSERAKFNAFKARSDGYLRSVLSNPENPPAIDWKAYRAQVSTPELVDQLEKAYKSLQIPYPKDTRTSEVDAQEQENKKSIEDFCKSSDTRIEDAKKLLNKFELMLPYDHMMQEEFTLTFPDWSIRWQDPSIWPHTEKTPGLTKEEVAQLKKPDGPPYSID